MALMIHWLGVLALLLTSWIFSGSWQFLYLAVGMYGELLEAMIP
jgi:hypothetical protein